MQMLDMLVLVWRREEELDMINRHNGLVNYVKEYWKGFFPFLLIEVLPDDDDGVATPRTSSDVFNRAVALSSDFHKIVIHESDFSDSGGGDLSFVTETVARFFGHCRLFNCDKRGEGINKREGSTKTHWTCAGLCQLSTYPCLLYTSDAADE